MGGSKGERKAKSKPKQRTAQLSTSANGFVSTNTPSVESPNNNGNRRKDARSMSSGNAPPVPSNETKEPMDLGDLPLNDMDGIDGLGVDSEIGEPQDLNSWFDMDGLQDHDSIGLDIPMDDLAELNMF